MAKHNVGMAIAVALVSLEAVAIVTQTSSDGQPARTHRRSAVVRGAPTMPLRPLPARQRRVVEPVARAFADLDLHAGPLGPRRRHALARSATATLARAIATRAKDPADHVGKAHVVKVALLAQPDGQVLASVAATVGRRRVVLHYRLADTTRGWRVVAAQDAIQPIANAQ